MSDAIQILVPDIGDFEDVDVIDILVAPGQAVVPEDPLITLESDKATMDIPAPAAGTVGDILVKVGDKVSEGSLIVTLNSDASADASVEPATPTPPAASRSARATATASTATCAKGSPTTTPCSA